MKKERHKVRGLVDDIKRGEIALPALQRGYVWKATQVRDLFDSLYRDYPTGSFLLWQPDKKEMPTKKAAIRQEGRGDWQRLLLDGQQRLMSLSAVLEGEPIQVRDSKKPIEIMFNMNHPEDDESESSDVNQEGDEESGGSATSSGAPLENLDKMTFIVRSKVLEKDQNWVLVTDAIRKNSLALLKEKGIGADDERFEKFFSRIERLKGIEKYEYDVVLLQGMKYETVTNIFVRVNSAGTTLKSWDLALSQITVTWKEALEVFEEYLEEKKSAGIIDFKLAVRALAAFATNQATFKTLHRLPSSKLKESWEDAAKHLDLALDFIKDLGFEKPTLLPSPYFLVTMAKYMKEGNRDKKELEEIKFWLFMACMKGRYSSSIETALGQDIAAASSAQELRRILRAKFGRFRLEPQDIVGMNRRNSLFKVLFIVLKDGGFRDWYSRSSITLDSVSKSNRLNAHHIFPQALLKKADRSNKEIDDIANLTFLTEKTNKEIGKASPEEYLSKIEEDLLIPHLIPLDRNLWKLENYQDFLAARRKLIVDAVNDFLKVDKFEKEFK
ncbi:MAG: DUF262 domain-containing protein [Betaproteobacteria bacterium AqS2]|uniref:DUF262 domain-containing protein n=1 Tax=Candidatus Amphirhobacter heronislandensis TaxID=1732024 RepID=A0A930XXP9_9GAMM|nr:DUF262 domain-containing protein [Betaproteobacteria bacterium AqS2]